MKFKFVMLVLIMLVVGAILTFPAEEKGLIYLQENVLEGIEAESESKSDDWYSEIIKYVVTVISIFILGKLAWLFGYLAVKFPKLGDIFFDLQKEISNIIQILEERRKKIPGELTAKQGVELKNEAVAKVMQTKPANELRRGIANIFGIFGGKSKEVGKQLFDSVVPGLIDKQVEKIKTKL